MPFRDRIDAGRQLGKALAPRVSGPAVVLGLPRGGVPVAFEVARELDAPLDVIVARKLGAPSQPELGVGAIAEGGARVLNQRVIDALGLSEADLDDVTAREQDEMERRLRRYRGDRSLPDVAERTAVVVDDGLATGVTAEAAVESVRRLGPQRLVLAVPVAAAETVRRLSATVDDLVTVEAPEDFMAVGMWYHDFAQTRDEEVIALLDRAAATADSGGGRR